MCVSHSMVRGILIFATTSREASTLYDSARFSASWSRHSDNPLVLFEQNATISSVTLCPFRLACRMGICIRRAYQRVLSILPHVISRAAHPGAHNLEEQLDLSFRFQYALPGSICSVCLWSVSRAQCPSFPCPYRPPTSTIAPTVHRIYTVVARLQHRKACLAHVLRFIAQAHVVSQLYV